MTDISYNFVLCGLNTAQLRGGVTSPSELVGGEAFNLVDFGRASAPWINDTLGPHGTELLITYPSAQSTRALHLGGGRIPIFGTTIRVVRGWHLVPTLVLWESEIAATNATGALDRTVDPRIPAAASFIGPTTPGTDWTVTLDFAEPEFGWNVDAEQKLVILAYASIVDGDPTMKIEVKNAGGSFVELGTVSVTEELGGSGAAPRFSFRLPASGISSPPEVRVTGTVVATGDLNLHGLAFVAPVNTDDDALRLTGLFLAESGGVTGTAAQTRHNPLDANVVEEDGLELPTGSDVRIAIEPDAREPTAVTLKFSWVPTGADEFRAELFFDGVLDQVIATYSGTPGVVSNESTALSVAGLDDMEGAELFLTRTSGAAEVRISGIAFHCDFEAQVEVAFHDTDWSPIQENDSSDITGGGAIDHVGRTVDVSVARDWRDGTTGDSIAVRAPQTFIDFEVPNDPTDPDLPLLMATQPSSFVSFRNLFEGPGLSGMELGKGDLYVEYDDTSLKDLTMGGFPVLIKRRTFRKVAFRLGKLSEGVGPEQVGALLHRSGQSEPILFIVLPQRGGLSQLFSLFGLVDKSPKVKSRFSRLVDGDISMREF